MSAALGMTRDSLENRIYERRGQSVWTETDLQMQKFSGTTHFAEAIATLSGGTFVKLPCVQHVDNDDLLVKFNELHVELGELSRRFADSTKDGEIDAREEASLRAVGDDIHRTMEELLALTFRIYCRRTGKLHVPSRSE